MNVQDIIDLTKAGWSKEEIFKLAELEKAKPEEPPKEEPPKEEPTKEEPPKEEPAKEEKKESTDLSKLGDIVARLDAKLDKISSGLEKDAIRETRLPERESVEDTLAQIINPFYKEE